MKWYTRAIVSFVVGAGFSIITALVLTVVDLHLTGHSRPSLNHASIPVFGSPYNASPSDVIFVAGFVVPGLATWLLTRRLSRGAMAGTACSVGGEGGRRRS